MSEDPETGGTRARQITPELIVATLGDIAATRIAALVATGASVEEFEEAVAWAAGESDVMGEMEKRLGGKAAAVYDILTAEEQFSEEDR